VTCGHRRNAIIRRLSDSAHKIPEGISKFGRALGTARSLRIDGHTGRRCEFVLSVKRGQDQRQELLGFALPVRWRD